MPRFIKRASKKAGLPPGALIHIGERKAEKVRITLIDYDAKQLHETEAKNIEECFAFEEKSSVTWINIDGIHRIDLIEKIGERFSIHPLTLEDILNTGQRPKAEDFEDYLYVVLKMLYYDAKNDGIKAEQISFILSARLLISFQEIEGDIFPALRERIRKGKGRIRKSGSDYLLYALVDAIVDHYFLVLETFGDRIESMEEELITNPSPEALKNIHDMKREIILLRKLVWPLRDILNNLIRMESPLIKESTVVFLRDVHDHIIQVIDSVESFRDILSGMLDVYLSTVSYKMNQVMKLLTIIATIFIPITFVAGIYGMNFKNMPELEWRWGYFGVMMLMGGVAGVMLFYFRKKKWL